MLFHLPSLAYSVNVYNERTTLCQEVLRSLNGASIIKFLPLWDTMSALLQELHRSLDKDSGLNCNQNI